MQCNILASCIYFDERFQNLEKCNVVHKVSKKMCNSCSLSLECQNFEAPSYDEYRMNTEWPRLKSKIQGFYECPSLIFFILI